jgi:hypothetical protein
MDSFYEDIVKRDNGTLGKIFPVTSVIGAVILTIIVNIFPMLIGYNIIFFTGMFTLLIWFLVWYLNRKLKVEYEISMVNDQITATSITAMTKREELCSFTVRDCEFIGPTSSDRFDSDKANCEFTLNCTENREIVKGEDDWYLLVNAGNYRYMLVFRFNADVYPLLRRFNPRATVIKPELVRGRQ